MINCSDCQNEENILEENGEYVCGECGLVLGLIYNSSKEITAKEQNSTSKKSLLVDVPQTELSDSRWDAQGSRLSAQTAKKFRNLKIKNNRVMNSTQRSLRPAFHELKRLHSQLELPQSCLDEAAWIYRQAYKENLIRGYSRHGIAASSLYLATRKASLPFSLKEFCEVANVDSKELGRCVRLLIMRLGIKSERHDLRSLVYRLGAELSMTVPTRRIAIDIIRQAETKGFTVGKNPNNIAAGALYIAGIQTGERRTQQQLARVAKTTPVTIRHRFKELVKVLGITDIDVRRGAAAIPVYIDDPYSLIEEA